MVTIVDFKEVQTQDGKQFVSITLQGQPRLVQSETTGNFYLTANKTRVASSIPLSVCQLLLGSQLPGTVDKIVCEPYKYTNKETGEVLTLDYMYVYSPEEQKSMFPSFPQQPLIQQNQIPLGEFNVSGVMGQA